MLQITVGQAAGIIAAAILIGKYSLLVPNVSSSQPELKLGYGLQVASLC
jgi:hypothetical protein